MLSSQGGAAVKKEVSEQGLQARSIHRRHGRVAIDKTETTQQADLQQRGHMRGRDDLFLVIVGDSHLGRCPGGLDQSRYVRPSDLGAS